MFDMMTAPVATIILILNVLVMIMVNFQDQSLMEKGLFRIEAILGRGEWYRIISSAFLHVDIGHLFFNMFTLYFFGPILEITVGSGLFMIIYLGSALASSGFSLAMHKTEPMYSAVGASGAISGILVSFCLFYPFEKIYLFLIPFGIPAFLFAIGYIAYESYASQANNKPGILGHNVAHDAHLGGALGGIAITVALVPDVIWSFLSVLGF